MYFQNRTQIIGFISAFIACWIIITLNKKIYSSNKAHLNQPQAIHTGEISRSGGLALIIGISTEMLFGGSNLVNITGWLLLLSIFVVGFYEDITHSISAKIRLILIAAISLFTITTQKIVLNHLDIFFLDELLKISPIAIIFSTFAITGIVNAYNIIDGLNGLAIILATIAIASFTYLAHQANLYQLVTFDLILISTMIGFLLWNFPSGKIFLGDGGAYLIGFIISCNSIYTSNQLPDISPWFFVIANIYPIVETLFSMYRRWGNKSLNAIHPDFKHMHSLIYLYMKKLDRTEALSIKSINSLASLIIIISSLLFTLVGLQENQNTAFLLFMIALYLLAYVQIYNLLEAKIFPIKQ